MQLTSFVAVLAGASTVCAHGVILAAEGDKGTSQGFLVNKNVARNCTNISPCQQDSTIIRDAEIKQNIVNGCGRTELDGNIDIGEQTETELSANRMTQVSAGSTVAVTIHQVNADGAGPYECDLDATSKCESNSRLCQTLTAYIRQCWNRLSEASGFQQRAGHQRSLGREVRKLHDQRANAERPELHWWYVEQPLIPTHF